MAVAWDMGTRQWKGPGEPLAQPARHARRTRASGGRSAQRSAPGASASGPRRTPPPARGGDGKREVPGQSAWGDKWKISHGIRNCFATGDPPVERLLRNRNGSISRNFLHISIKLTLGRGGQWGPRMGDRGGNGERGGSMAGSEQAEAGLSHRDLLPRGLAATGRLSSQACRPPPARPGTASGRRGCS